MRQKWVEKGMKTNEDGKEVIVMEATLTLHGEMATWLSNEDREKWMMQVTESLLLNEAAEAYKQSGNLHKFVRDAEAVVCHATWA